MARTVIYLDGRDLERDCGAVMKFRLVYSGELLSSKPPKNPGDPTERDKRAGHKHDIRRCFHRQLRTFWETNPFLSTTTMDAASRILLPEGAGKLWETNPSQRFPMSHVLAETYSFNGYKYVPLVRGEISLTCSLRILCIRRDGANSMLPARDIDNRIKTVIDALTMPLPQQGQPVGLDGKILAPQEGEDFFYVLLDDDRQVTHLEVETDTLLDSPDNATDSFVHLIVSVDIRPYNVNLFNLSFA